ncbi:MAG: transposase, partial [Chloroflexi bacterium]|nr:transposase [Chloroflexota bacterium]
DYRSKCRLRPAIEGTISQFKQKMRNGKLRIRGLSRIRNSIILMAIGINFGRVCAYLMETNPGIALFSSVFVLLAFVLAIMATRQPTYSDFKHCGTISA